MLVPLEEEAEGAAFQQAHPVPGLCAGEEGHAGRQPAEVSAWPVVFSAPDYFPQDLRRLLRDAKWDQECMWVLNVGCKTEG